jgi:hypothetical protein
VYLSVEPADHPSFHRSGNDNITPRARRGWIHNGVRGLDA